MSLTLTELREYLLNTYDPDALLEALEISSEELLDRFDDKLVDNIDKFEEDFINDEEENEDAVEGGYS